MPQGPGKLIRAPVRDLLHRRQAFGIDVDNRGIGLGQFLEAPERAAVNFLGDGEAFAARFRQADDFLEPGCSGGFDVQAGVVLPDQAADDRIEREFVAAGMDAEFQGRGKAELADREVKDQQVFLEFLFELGEVAHVIDAFVEASRELGRNGLDGNFFPPRSLPG